MKKLLIALLLTIPLLSSAQSDVTKLDSIFRASTGGKGFSKNDLSDALKAKYDSVRSKPTFLTSPSQFTVIGDPVVNYGGFDWVKTAGSITSPNLAYPGMKQIGPAGFHFAKLYKGPLSPDWWGAIAYERIYTKTSGGNEGYYADAGFTTPCVESTAAIQKAFDYASQVGLTKKDVLLSGIYITRTIYWPEGVAFGSQGTAIEYGGSAVLQQAWGDTNDIVRLRGHTTNGAVWHYGKIHDLTIRGNWQKAGVKGLGLSYRDESNNLVRPQDQTLIENLVIEGCGSGGIRLENGGIPFTINRVKLLNNNGDGIFIIGGTSIVQTITLNEISGDANNGALIHLKNFAQYGTVKISSFKSECRVNDYYGSAKMQQNAFLFEECDRTPIKISSGDHVCSTMTGPSFDKPGDLIKILSDSLTPNLEWENVSIRVRNGDVGTNPNIVKQTDPLDANDVKIAVPYKDAISGNTNSSGRLSPGGVIGDYTTGYQLYRVLSQTGAYMNHTVEAPGFQIAGLTPGFSYHETDAPANKKTWTTTVSAGSMQSRIVKDNGTAVTYESVNRDSNGDPSMKEYAVPLTLYSMPTVSGDPFDILVRNSTTSAVKKLSPLLLPIQTAVQDSLNARARLTGATFTGNVSVNSGSGTNVVTVRDGTITKATASNWAFSSGIGAAGSVTAGGSVQSGGTANLIGGGSPDGAAVLTINSTSKGFLGPRMTAAQRVALGAPVPGLEAFQTDGTIGQYVYFNSIWNRYLTDADLATLPVSASNVSGTLSIGQLPVAASGVSSSTALVRADDSRLSGGVVTNTDYGINGIALSSSPLLNAQSTKSLTSGTGYSYRVTAPVSATVTKVLFEVTTGAGTLSGGSSGNNVAIFNSSGTQVGWADCTAGSAFTTNGVKSVSLASSMTVTAGTEYIIVVVCTASTPLSLVSTNAISNINAGIAAAPYRHQSKASFTVANGGAITPPTGWTATVSQIAWIGLGN